MDCVNALLHRDNALIPQCDRDVRTNYIAGVYNDNNLALQLAVDYLQLRGIEI